MWHVVANDETGLWEIHDEEGLLCSLESESTAHLIAAAPEMFAALHLAHDEVALWEADVQQSKPAFSADARKAHVAIHSALDKAEV